jgi:hypothetical protein
MARELIEITTEINSLLAEHDGKIPEQDRMRIEDELSGIMWTCARFLDKAKGIDPYKEPRSGPRPYGTQNHRSYTYKVRKALGYSYP